MIKAFPEIPINWIPIEFNCISTDIDECESNNGDCNHTCTNTEGSYNCSCHVGYRLASDDHACNGKHKYLS